MCIIIYKPKKAKLSKSLLATCWLNNPDGGGFMYTDRNKLKIIKEVASFRRWYDLYRANKPDTRDMVVHFRIGTSGLKDRTNCHPHRINKTAGFAHNGIIPIAVPKDSPVSDTVLFNEKVLKHMPAGFLKNPGILELIAEYIKRSKIVFMDNQNHVSIVNEQLGSWDKECWFSNKSYEAPKKPKPYWRTYRTSQVYGDQTSWFDRSKTGCLECGLEINRTQKEENMGLCDDCVKWYQEIKGNLNIPAPGELGKPADVTEIGEVNSTEII